MTYDPNSPIDLATAISWVQDPETGDVPTVIYRLDDDAYEVASAISMERHGVDLIDLAEGNRCVPFEGHDWSQVLEVLAAAADQLTPQQETPRGP